VRHLDDRVPEALAFSCSLLTLGVVLALAGSMRNATQWLLVPVCLVGLWTLMLAGVLRQDRHDENDRPLHKQIGFATAIWAMVVAALTGTTIVLIMLATRVPMDL
jgi:hypothetical protein